MDAGNDKQADLTGFETLASEDALRHSCRAVSAACEDGFLAQTNEARDLKLFCRV